MTSVRSIYVTCADEQEAARIAQELLDRRLIACANVLPPIASLYRWEGKVVRDTEVAMILKATADRQEEALEAILALHSYEVPCAVAWPVIGGIPSYLAWVRDETAPKESEHDSTKPR